MKNPVAIYTKPDEDFVMISGFVKSVVDQGSYNSVSFKVDSEASGVTDLISVMCFENKCGQSRASPEKEMQKGKMIV